MVLTFSITNRHVIDYLDKEPRMSKDKASIVLPKILSDLNIKNLDTSEEKKFRNQIRNLIVEKHKIIKKKSKMIMSILSFVTIFVLNVTAVNIQLNAVKLNWLMS